MPEKGDVYDLGNNEYLEYIEKFDDLHDYVIHYTREPMPNLGEVKLHRLVETNGLDGEYRKVGPNEKNRLLSVYKRAVQKRSPELDNLLQS